MGPIIFRKDNLPLFNDSDIDVILKNKLTQALYNIDGIPKDQFLSTSEDDLQEHILSSSIIYPIKLHEKSMEMEEEEIKIEIKDYGRMAIVPGIEVTVSIPFTGDSSLWMINPSIRHSPMPEGNIRNPVDNGIGYLDIVIKQPIDEEHRKIKQTLDANIRTIRHFLDIQKTKIELHNANLQDKILEAIRKRRARIKTHDSIVEALKIPLKRNKDAPKIQPLPIRRKLVRPLPIPPKSGLKKEPGILESDYEHILSVIRHEGRTYETTPKTFLKLGEEELRDIILAHLNGHYHGSATGETFRRRGKTDIRIEDHDRTAFVAECKVWGGSKTLADAINQLLGYLTWRDCKAAIILFNKNVAKFSDLLQKVPETFAKHAKLKKNLGGKCVGEWRYILISDEDAMRYIYVHVFLFNLYIKGET